MIDFETAPYVRSHGKEPRGRGSWAFSIIERPDVNDPNAILWSPAMTYTKAKAWAVAQIRERYGKDSSGTLFVQP